MEIDSRLHDVLFPLFVNKAGDRFRSARIEMKLTQIELAHELGCSQALIAKIEIGKIRKGGFSFAVFEKVFGERAKTILLGE